jgi:hypothetical protein
VIGGLYYFFVSQYNLIVGSAEEELALLSQVELEL